MIIIDEILEYLRTTLREFLGIKDSNCDGNLITEIYNLQDELNTIKSSVYRIDAEVARHNETINTLGTKLAHTNENVIELHDNVRYNQKFTEDAITGLKKRCAGLKAEQLELVQKIK